MKKRRIYLTLFLCLTLIFSNTFNCVAGSYVGYNVGLKERYQLYTDVYNQFEAKAIFPVDDTTTADLIYNQMAKLYADYDMSIYDYVFFYISTSAYSGDFNLNCYGIKTTGSLEALCYTHAIDDEGHIVANTNKEGEATHYLDETRVDVGIYRNGMNGFYLLHSDDMEYTFYESTVSLDGTLNDWKPSTPTLEESSGDTLSSFAVIPSDTTNVTRGVVYANCPIYGNIDLAHIQGFEEYQTNTNSNVCARPSLTTFIEMKDQLTDYNKGACWNGDTITVDNMQLKENEFMGFQDFAVRRTIDYSIFGNYGAILTYTLPANYEEFVTPTSKLVLEVTWTYGVATSIMTSMEGFNENGGPIEPNFLIENCIYDTVTVELSQSITSSSGQIAFDFASTVLDDEEFYNANTINAIIASINYEQGDDYSLGDFVTDNVISLGSSYTGVDLSGILLGDKYRGITSMECNIKGYITNGVEQSKISYGYVDLIDGVNQSIANQPNSYDDDNNVIEGGSNGNNNLSDVERDTNENGETVYTEVKVDGSSSNAEVINNVTFPDTITVNVNGVSSGGGSSGGSPDIIVEDDDYTDNELREDLADGFGMFDDLTTEKDNDGFLAMLGLAFSTINPDLSDILGFGISTVVVVNILRALLKR